MKTTEQKKNIRKWIRALRSGKYKQARGTLHNVKGGGFCCLGVACDISKIDEWKKTKGNNCASYLNNTGSLPKAVNLQLGLTVKEKMKLVRLNDGAKYNFDTIADYIEKKILKS